MAAHKALSVLCLVVCCVSAALAQIQGDITGEVSDVSGAVIPGATVIVTNQGTNASRQVMTNGAGVYSFPSLLPGIYQVRVEKAGFQSMMRSGIALQVQAVARIDFRMDVGQGSEGLNVSSQAGLPGPGKATTRPAIENRRIRY